MKDQFIDFTMMENIDLGEKSFMSDRVSRLLEEFIDLSKYGSQIKSVLFTPIIGAFLIPKNRFDIEQEKLILEFYIDPQEAIEATEEQFFILHIEGLQSAIKTLSDLPEHFDFDFDMFLADLELLAQKFDLLKEIV